MKIINRITSVVLDFFESVGLLVCLLLSSPLLFFRKMEFFSRCYWSLVYLLPNGLISSMIRANLDKRLGNYDQAAYIYLRALDLFEKKYAESEDESKSLSNFLIHLYSSLINIYLVSGRIDDASRAVIRAHNEIGIENLPGLHDLDVKTSHIIKAGVAAGRLLDDGGLATLTVNHPVEKPKSKSHRGSSIKDKKGSDLEKGAKVLPFPTLQRP